MTPDRALVLWDAYCAGKEWPPSAETRIYLILAATAEERHATLTEAAEECERRSETIKSCSSEGFVYRQACADCVAYIELLRDHKVVA